MKKDASSNDQSRGDKTSLYRIPSLGVRFDCIGGSRGSQMECRSSRSDSSLGGHIAFQSKAVDLG